MDSIDPKILLVGEEGISLRDYSGLLERSGFQVRMRPPGVGIFDDLFSFEPRLILVELSKPGIDWRRIFREARERPQFIPIIFLASLEAAGEAAEVVKEGAADFLIQPVGAQALLFRIRKALERQQLEAELKSLQRELRFRRNEDYIVGGSAGIQFLLGEIIKIAGADLNVMITGETGTGKELVARAIHYNGKRAGRPFIAVNCSAIPDPLLENQMFGHVKGSYTGADAAAKGLYEEADGGTLFFDEIGDLPFPLQAKLLKVLESGEFRKIGGIETVRVDVRTLAATHKDLSVEVKEGRFREDLFYRLNAFPIHIPPLRRRKEDIPLLVNHFCRLHQDKLDKKLEGFSTSAIQKLMFYDWPGNVRELENRVRQAMINAAGPLVYREDIQLEENGESHSFKSFKEAKQEFEKNYVMNVLRITNGNVTEAAKLAQKERKDFYDLMRKHRLHAQKFRSP
ncbi:MAG TPA: sigma-54 dependent transcriptional regulator [Candidatus Manganitrophaceae bacterium]|nr:sigma-54 dependent transcriptional regulator [Candidatus Manganitrophaceae bacterium]